MTSTKSDPAFADTNVLVYAFDQSRSAKKTVARQLLDELLVENRLRLSTQVLQELFVTLTRKVERTCSPSEALAVLDELAVWPVFLVDYAAIRQAGRLCGEASLSFWDALIVVSAFKSGARWLYSEDLNHGQRILGVEIVNPFREVH